MIDSWDKFRLYTTTLNTDDQFLLEVEQISIDKQHWTSTFEIRGYILDYKMNLDDSSLSYKLEVYMGMQNATSYIRGDTVFQYQKDGGITWISREAVSVGQPLYEHSRCHFFTHRFTINHSAATTYSDKIKFVITVDVQAHRHDSFASYDYLFNSTYGYGDDGTYTSTPQYFTIRANLLEEGESDTWSIKPELPFTYFDEPIKILYQEDHLKHDKKAFGILKYRYKNAEIEIKRITHDEYIATQGYHSYEWTPSNDIASSFFATGEYVKDITLVLEVIQESIAYPPPGYLYGTYTTELKIFQSSTVERPGVSNLIDTITFEKYKPQTKGDRYARYIDDVLVTVTQRNEYTDATAYMAFIQNGNSTYTIDYTAGETSKVVYDIEDYIFNVTAIDTLGRRVTTSKQLGNIFYEYFYPTARISKTVLSGNTGTLTFTVEGEMYLDVYDASGVRNIMRHASYGVYDSEDLSTPVVWNNIWAFDEEMNPTYGDGTYSFTITVPNLNYMRSYVLLVSIGDKFYSVTAEKARAKLDPIFDWSKDDFNFNVPVAIHPNGTEDTAHEVRITDSGNIELAGDIIINGKSLVQILTNAGLLT